MDERNLSADKAVKELFERRDGTVDIDGLNKAADAVERTMLTPGWELLVGMLGDERERTLTVLDRADPPGRSTFARAHGFARGVTAVHDYARALVAFRTKTMERQRSKHEGPAATAGVTEG